MFFSLFAGWPFLQQQHWHCFSSKQQDADHSSLSALAPLAVVFTCARARPRGGNDRSSEGPIKTRDSLWWTCASLHPSQRAHDESLHLCSRENASVDYWHSGNSSSLFPSGTVSPHWPVSPECVDSALPDDDGDINNLLHVKEMEEMLLHASALLQMRSTDHQFQSALSAPLTWAPFIKDAGKEAGCCSSRPIEAHPQWTRLQDTAELQSK